MWDVTVQKESAFLQGWSGEFTFGEELLMEHALSHHSLREGVPGELDGLHRGTFSLPPECTEMGTRWRLKLVRAVSSLLLLPWKDLLELGMHVMYRSCYHISLKDIGMLFKCSQESWSTCPG